MSGFARNVTIVVAAVAVLAGLLAAVAWASPGGSSGNGPAGVEATLVPTQTPDATGTPEATATGEAQTPEATETEEPEETPDGEQGVPLDSPACAGDLEHPNPHDTDGDGDGCREVETDDGLKNLPDPAADAHEGDPGHIGDLHGNDDGNGDGNNGNGAPAHARTPGPPDGDPPHGNANSHDD